MLEEAGDRGTGAQEYRRQPRLAARRNRHPPPVHRHEPCRCDAHVESTRRHLHLQLLVGDLHDGFVLDRFRAVPGGSPQLHRRVLRGCHAARGCQTHPNAAGTERGQHHLHLLLALDGYLDRRAPHPLAPAGYGPGAPACVPASAGINRTTDATCRGSASPGIRTVSSLAGRFSHPVSAAAAAR